MMMKVTCFTRTLGNTIGKRTFILQAIDAVAAVTHLP